MKRYIGTDRIIRSGYTSFEIEQMKKKLDEVLHELEVLRKLLEECEGKEND